MTQSKINPQDSGNVKSSEGCLALFEGDSIFGFYKGKLKIVGDIVAPIYSDEELEEFEKHQADLLR